MKQIFPLAVFAAFWMTSSVTAQNRGDMVSAELLQIRTPEDIETEIASLAGKIPEDLVLALVPTRPVRIPLADNDLLDFTPQSRVLLLSCSEDEQISPVNATVAWFVYKFVQQSPAKIGRLSLGPFTHGKCIPHAIIVTKLSFDSLRIR